jgi:hypothetical protein
MKAFALNTREKRGRGGYIKLLTRLHEDLYQKKLKCHYISGSEERMRAIGSDVKEKNIGGVHKG